MKRNIKPTNLKERLLEVAGALFDAIETFDAKLKDVDQKVEYLIRRDRNGQNHQ